ncbi:predicted protein [Scheffersomyces stipitis CBS 6054]|uniref:Vacuolar protein sorting-associated protein 51 homolog n=1 Tax=Scheffersomyces stipitis (strain ATCC 58785 / CBS 6054 / NBRC 10063 / NRRL Y-11545) TaxID=322104 RepID=A3LTC8_PICST|nr:predicted protein [Scheffersomyces stipitis CBS 6054]ABN66383.2 predicted protein [Scheffersomyces stipitis CBS 6054]
MAEGQLSYKKPSLQTGANGSRSQVSSPQLNTNNSNNSVPGSPSTPTVGTRKISSRRKALQEFYNIQEKEDVNGSENTPTKSSGHDQINLQDPAELASFVKNASIEEILKLRNSVSSKLNTHDSEKKSIIYDNYYELIKLSQTLESISNARPQFSNSTTLNGLGIYEENGQNTSEAKDSDYLESTLSELSSFITSESSKFNDNFETIVQKLQENNTNDFDSAASIISIVDDNNKFSAVDRKSLSVEVNQLLNKKLLEQLPEDQKGQVITEIETILQSLDVHKDELLILQLNDIKKSLIS